MTIKVYYNEWEPYCAQWLRNLIDAGHLPPGDVDERSITDVEPEELKGYSQHHFFAGIGGWALSARLAGVSDNEQIVTGSPPCQPFSTAGQGGGYNDERHLAPHWLRLVAAIRPTWVFGEQVAAAIRKDDWLDDLLDALEGEGYATGATVLPACSVGAPHIRQRLWVTARLADSYSSVKRMEQASNTEVDQRREGHTRVGHWSSGDNVRVVNSGYSQRETRGLSSGVHKEHDAARDASPLFGFYGTEPSSGNGARLRSERASSIEAGWDNSDWLWCRDGKWRPVESGTSPLANGIPARVGRLRAYGNAIVPQVAAEVIKEAMNYDY